MTSLLKEKALNPYLNSVRQTASSLYQVTKVRKAGLKTVADINIPKKSDTIFLLGSGPSINAINDRQFDKIQENSSIGFNFWAIHPFVPNLYALQATPNPSLDRNMAEIFSHKRKLYENVDFIVRGSRFNQGAYFQSEVYRSTLGIGRHYYSGEIFVHSKVSVSTPFLCGLFDIARIWGPGKPRPFAPKIGASITYLIMLAVQLGYRDIVLCGIDMNDQGHFYDAFNRSDYAYSIPISGKAATHPHMEGHKINVLGRIVGLQRYIQRFGVTLWNASESSQLMRYIPPYKWA